MFSVILMAGENTFLEASLMRHKIYSYLYLSELWDITVKGGGNSVVCPTSVVLLCTGS